MKSGSGRVCGVNTVCIHHSGSKSKMSSAFFRKKRNLPPEPLPPSSAASFETFPYESCPVSWQRKSSRLVFLLARLQYGEKRLIICIKRSLQGIESGIPAHPNTHTKSKIGKQKIEHTNFLFLFFFIIIISSLFPYPHPHQPSLFDVFLFSPSLSLLSSVSRLFSTLVIR